MGPADIAELSAPRGLEAHIWFIACYLTTAILGVGAAFLAAVRRRRAGALVRLFSGLTALGGFAAVVAAALAVPSLPNSQWGPDPEIVVCLAAFALCFTGLVTALTAAEPRVAALVALASALAGSGLLMNLLLYAAAPETLETVEWELKRLSVYASFAALMATLLGAIGAVVSVRPAIVARSLHGVSVVVGLAALAAALSLSAGSALREVAIMLVLLLPFIVWLVYLPFRARPPIIGELRADERTGLVDRLALSVLAGERTLRMRLMTFAGWLRSLPSSRDAVLAFALVPILLGLVALLFAGGDTARTAARVDLGGFGFTPALLVPFAFAPALGLILGCPTLKARGVWGLALTLIVVGLLVGQKEIGYTGVVLAVAAACFLAARGTILHLAATGGLGTLAIGLAVELQPMLPWIPFTVRERFMLWMGGAGYARRGGHLLIADQVTFDTGGYWGIGVDRLPDFVPHQVVNSLDTDLPLAAVGLYGGLPWLIAYILLFIALGVLLYDIARRETRQGSLRTSRWRLPTLIGLATVPVASTIINISGGVTQLTPFAGVPAAFLSYGTFFLGGTLAIVAFFMIAGSSDALATLVRERALAMRPKQAPTGEVGVAEREDPPQPWWSRGARSWRGLRLFLRRLGGRLRLATVDAGAIILMAGLVALGLLWTRSLQARYTDRPEVHAHPGLSTSVRIRTLIPGEWQVATDKVPGWGGVLDEDRFYRLDGFEMRYRPGRVEVTGACFPWTLASTRGIQIGFEGLRERRLEGFSGASATLAERLGARADAPNDLVLPMAAVWLKHLRVVRTHPGRFELVPMTPGAQFALWNDKGQPVSGPRSGVARVRAGWTFSLGDDERLRFRIDEVAAENVIAARTDRIKHVEGEVCLRNADAPIFSWPLSRWRDTLIGGVDLLRRAPTDRTVDLGFAEDLKAAAEAHIIGFDSENKRLRLIDWKKEARERWDPLTRRRFFRVFRVSTTEEGEEVLRWVRAFYRDGGSRVRLDAEIEAFEPGWGQLLGLKDPFRFSRSIAATRSKVIRDPGRILGANGAILAQLADDGSQFEIGLRKSGALVGYGFPQKGIYGGLIRNFRHLLMGRPIRSTDPDAELSERILKRAATHIGVDVMLTVDADVQDEVTRIVEDETRALWKEALSRGDIRWQPRGRAIVLGPENEVVALSSFPNFDGSTLEQVLRTTAHQTRDPLSAPDLDAMHRTTTVGSTAKIGVLVAAAANANEHFAPYGKDDICIRADDDPPNEYRGCFIERGSLKTFRNEPIEPVRNFGGGYFGGVTTIRQLIVKSVNTAASYVAGRLGLEGLTDFYSKLELTRPYDLFPDIIEYHPQFAIDIDRWHGDPMTAWRARLGELPAGDTWRTSYDVRLGLSGFCDFSIFHVGVAAAIAARDGRHYRPYMVRALRDLADGTTVSFEQPHPLQVVPVRVARHLKEAMVDTVKGGTAAGLKRQLPKRLWTETGGKTGTGETVRLQPDVRQNPNRRKPQTQDHKFFVGFWPASSRNPYVIVTGFEYVSHLDVKVAVRTFGRIVEVLDERFGDPASPASRETP